MTRDKFEVIMMQDGFTGEQFEFVCNYINTLEAELKTKDDLLYAQQQLTADIQISLNRRIAELEAMVEKMKCCENCSGANCFNGIGCDDFSTSKWTIKKDNE
jgi:hypothetical protein